MNVLPNDDIFIARTATFFKQRNKKDNIHSTGLTMKSGISRN